MIARFMGGVADTWHYAAILYFVLWVVTGVGGWLKRKLLYHPNLPLWFMGIAMVVSIGVGIGRAAWGQA